MRNGCPRKRWNEWCPCLRDGRFARHGRHPWKHSSRYSLRPARASDVGLGWAVDDEGLVGRGRELAELTRRLEAARAGNGGLVLVEGDAGAGKTALANSVVRRARQAGMRTGWGACLES